MWSHRKRQRVAATSGRARTVGSLRLVRSRVRKFEDEAAVSSPRGKGSMGQISAAPTGDLMSGGRGPRIRQSSSALLTGSICPRNGYGGKDRSLLTGPPFGLRSDRSARRCHQAVGSGHRPEP